MAGGFSRGIAAGTAMRNQRMLQEKQKFDIQQARIDNFDKIVTDAESTLKQLNEQFAMKRAAAPTGEDQAKIDQLYQQSFESVIKPISRAGELANQSGVPIDLPVSLARFVPLRQLPDLNAEALVGAQAKGQERLQTRTAELQAQAAEAPLQGAKPFIDAETGQTVFITPAGEIIEGGRLQNLPSTRINVEQTPPQAPAEQEGFRGVGTQVMQDIEQTTGVAAGLSKGLSRVGGQFVEGVNPRLEAEQRVKNFNQEVKFAFSRNPRYPVSEINRITADLLPDPTAMLTDPQAESNKIPLLKQHLLDLNEADRRAFDGMSDKGQKEALDRMATRQAIMNLIGDVPASTTTIDEVDARIDSLDQKGIENLTPEEKNEMRQLLQQQGLL